LQPTDRNLGRAKSALAAGSPVLYDGKVRQSLHIERIAEDAWEGSVRSAGNGKGSADRDPG